MTILNSSKLAAVLERFEAIEHEMSQAPSGEDYVRLSREYAELEPVAGAARTLKALEQERRGLQDMLASGEAELAEMAEDELAALEIRADKLDREIKVLLLPRDSADERNVILEVRAGTGGDEAALFAGDLFRMYQRYAAVKNWRVEVITA
ncbi:MAG TPA: PCRF domain-containing protein, partial [Aestuariivirgaceae bacterium]|nr:PCRF domain-containing protein [Aestuariivirgaceae bacterium]